MVINEVFGYLCKSKKFEEEEIQLDILLGYDYSGEDDYLYGELKGNIMVVIDSLFFKCKVVF